MQPKKKVKFDHTNPAVADDDDEYDAEDLEHVSPIPCAAKKHRNAIKQGYTESDDEDLYSDDEPTKKKDGDDDMFGDDSDDDTKKTRKNKKDIAFLSKDKIDLEGAEQAGDDEEEGIKLDPFNMDQELEEGLVAPFLTAVSSVANRFHHSRAKLRGFDANFNYIKAKDEHQMHDNWLQGVSKSDIRKAKLAHDRQQARADAATKLGEQSENDNVLLFSALAWMKPKETIAGAIKRLGGSQKVPAWKKNKLKKGAKDAPAEPELTKEQQEENKKGLDALISMSDRLAARGKYDIMEQSYEQIVRTLRVAEVLDDDWQPGMPIPEPKAKITGAITLWEYKWGEHSEELFGPYPSDQMLEWQANGFFDASKGDVLVREVTANTPLDTMRGFKRIGDVKL
ncbi:hypothetical protein HDV05_003586 [Chytridiales sp. JEL 0842]|nr:hypothetical protein HDV05_003586 [Chytridiales sp. JEL 0842]